MSLWTRVCSLESNKKPEEISPGPAVLEVEPCEHGCDPGRIAGLQGPGTTLQPQGHAASPLRAVLHLL